MPDERRRLEAHFDVSAFATAIVSLSPPSDYEGGLYVQAVPGVPSRRYVPLSAGDGLVHQFDTMHGVHVPRGERFSLVVWFSDGPHSVARGAAPWIERAAQRGNAEAQFVLGGFLYRGEFGYAPDVHAAVRWLSRAAAHGNPLARLHVGSMLASGEVPAEMVASLCEEHGVGAATPPVELAAQLYARAAAQGHPTAEYAYGAALLSGEGVGRDVERGLHWLRRAAAQGADENVAAAWAADALQGWAGEIAREE
jgi:TPR repeat protein